MAGIVFSVSCQKINEYEEGRQPGASITKTFAVSENLWTPDGTRSTYIENDGLRLTGEEHISVFYAPYIEGNGETIENLQDDVEAIPAGNGKYTFSHTEISGAEAYNYYFLMPYSIRSNENSAQNGLSARLSPVQYPGANDIDPTNDWLVGRMQTNVSKSDELTVTEFKRIFAPFRLTVTDTGNLLEGEKIRTATLSFSQEAVNKSNSIVGVFYVSFSDDYENTGIQSFLSTAPGNAVSAVFDDGCEISGDGYPVWFMLNPVEISGGTATLTVSTDTRTVTRTASLAAPVTVMSGKFNSLSFDISGSGVLPEEESVTQTFTSLTSISQNVLTASDGKDYAYNFNGCRLTTDDGIAGVRLYNSSMDLPQFIAKKLVRLRVFTHRASANASGSGENRKPVTLTVSAGENTVASADFDYYALTKTGGVCEIEIPEEYAESALSLSCADNTSAYITAITYVFEDSSTDPDAPQLVSAEPSDAGYGNLYLGREVTVTGTNLDKVEKFVVDGVEAELSETPSATQAKFVMPATITGTSARQVRLSAVTGGETIDLGAVTVYPFYCTKGLRIGVGANSEADYTDDGRNMSFLLLNEGRVISAQEWVESGIDPFAASGTNTVTTSSSKVTGSEEDYYSVQPYMMLTSSGDPDSADESKQPKLAFQNPSNSNTQLRNHRYPDGDPVIGTDENGGKNSTYGTPVVKFRVIYNDEDTKEAVKDGTLGDISYARNMGNSNAPALSPEAEGESSSTWVKGSVILIQYLDYERATAGSGASSLSDVERQGYIYVRDITCADLATGWPLYPTAGYVEFDLYWSNPLSLQ